MRAVVLRQFVDLRLDNLREVVLTPTSTFDVELITGKP
jgi:hypothetical protein